MTLLTGVMLRSPHTALPIPLGVSSRAASCYLRVSLSFPFPSFFTLCILVNSTFIMYYH
jgi:hypothetical protein